MGEETKPQPRTIQSRAAAGKLGGRPKKQVPTREMILMELWGSKKITIARVSALKELLVQLDKAPAISSTPTTATLPDWMQAAE